MGIDFESGRFTSDQHEVLPAQTVKLIGEMESGDVNYIPSEAVWVSREDRKLWINGSLPAYIAEDLYDIGEFDDERDYARIICVNEGLIVDFSHIEQYSWLSLEERWERSGGPTEAQLFEGTVMPLPVIHVVYNSDELVLIKPILEQEYGLVLDDSELGPILATIIDAFEGEEGGDENEDEALENEGDDGEDLAA